MRPLTLRRMRPGERRILRAKLRTTTLPVRLPHRYRIIAEAEPVPHVTDPPGGQDRILAVQMQIHQVGWPLDHCIYE
jgi:hypothetical protein